MLHTFIYLHPIVLLIYLQPIPKTHKCSHIYSHTFGYKPPQDSIVIFEHVFDGPCYV
ncbi:hypothetical protein HanIR_Chr12g0594721 [Helianthus annuus]|nr:hypothetical protein HanIR_Chr12g0594721 [Helianthus annuus]